MIVAAFPIKISEERAREMSEKKVNVLTKFLLGVRPEIEIRTVFIENKIITFNITGKPPLIERFFKKNPEPRRSKIRMIANGSTCGVAYYDDKGVEIVEIDVDDDKLQLSDYPDEMLVTRGNALARRILRRRVGGSISLDVSDIRSVFRPYHVAFYGKLEQGRKVRYLPIAADACAVRRTF